jgi:hypothetical protein
MSIKDILITGKTARLPGDLEQRQPDMTRKRHKYGVAAREDRTAQGIVFASKREMEAFLALQRLEKAGVIRHLKRQVPFRWDVVYRANGKEYVKSEKYIADFTYMEGDKFVVADAKGAVTKTYTNKKRIMKELFGIEIREL